MQREQLLHPSAIIKLIPFLRILRLKMFRVFADATPCNSQAVSDTPTPPEQKKTKKKQCLKVLASHSVAVTCISSKQSKLAGPDYFLILGLQPCDKAAMLLVNWIQFFLEELTWKLKCFSSWPPTLPPWRHVKTSNTTVVDGYLWQIIFDIPSWTP